MEISDLITTKPQIANLICGAPMEIRKNAEVITVPENSILLEKGKPIDYFYLVLSGEVSIGKIVHDNIIFGVNNLKFNDIVGEMELLAGLEESYFTVTTSSNCVLLRIGSEYFNKWIDLDPFFTQWLAKLMAKKHCNLNYAFDEYSMMEPIAKLQLMLYRSLVNQIGTEDYATLDITREKLSEWLNVSPRTINRIIKQLKDDGEINIIRGKIAMDA